MSVRARFETALLILGHAETFAQALVGIRSETMV